MEVSLFQRFLGGGVRNGPRPGLNPERTFLFNRKGQRREPNVPIGWRTTLPGSTILCIRLWLTGTMLCLIRLVPTDSQPCVSVRVDAGAAKGLPEPKFVLVRTGSAIQDDPVNQIFGLPRRFHAMTIAASQKDQRMGMKMRSSVKFAHITIPWQRHF